LFFIAKERKPKGKRKDKQKQFLYLITKRFNVIDIFNFRFPPTPFVGPLSQENQKFFASPAIEEGGKCNDKDMSDVIKWKNFHLMSKSQIIDPILIFILFIVGIEDLLII